MEVLDKRKKYLEGYKEHNKNTKYHLNYYHSSKINIECPICNKNSFYRYLKQHQKSLKCQIIKENRDLE